MSRQRRRAAWALPSLVAASLLALSLAACGPSTDDIEATTTAIVATAIAGAPATAPLPTPAPTATPIVFPTPLPTATPVVFPTPLPTATPIALPTPLPTATPVVFPTPLPTATPIAFPTPSVPTEFLDVPALYRAVRASVVYIETPEQTGTGWVIAEGLIATNEHVVRGQTAVTVRQPVMLPFRAQVVFQDAVTDVAFLAYDAEAHPVAPLSTWQATADDLGGAVLVLGYSSVGVQDSGAVGGAAVKQGVLSQIVDFGEQGGRRLRIDAVVDPGDSGGPVIDALGRVVGMSKGVAEFDVFGRRVVGIFYAVHMEEIDELLARYREGAA